MSGDATGQHHSGGDHPPRGRIGSLYTDRNAVTLSAQTALRNAIGKHELALLLSERDRLGEEIQKVLDAKTSAWGITMQSVEIRDIIIPKGLEDATSRQAQAERERQSRIILGTAETEIQQMSATATTLSESSVAQASAIEQISSSIEEMGTNINQTADNSKEFMRMPPNSATHSTIYSTAWNTFSQLVWKLTATSFHDNFFAQCARNCR